MKKLILVISIVFAGFTVGFSQPVTESVNSADIRSVQIYRSGWQLSQPIIQLGSEEQITLSFDELGDQSKTYYYSVVHCSANWEVSDLALQEYMEGFQYNVIDDYNFSLNTTFSYVHYQVAFPNEDVKFLKSGNYIVKVYEDFNDKSPVIVRYFKVVEPLVAIDAVVKFPFGGNFIKTHQQLNLNILHPQLSINNPMQEVKVVVQQNGRTDNMVTNISPDFIRPGELVYENKRELLFQGGHQYRWLDIRSTRFLSENVQKVSFNAPYYHAELTPGEFRSNLPFFYKDDSNGQYVISVREYDDATIEADYLLVHFSLPVEAPMLEADVYVMGGLSGWKFTNANQMVYNYQSRTYELQMLLKQGFYNYMYAFVPKASGKADLSIIEGTHSETENDYHIFVYYRNPSTYYDRLVGYSVINSKK